MYYKISTKCHQYLKYTLHKIYNSNKIVHYNWGMGSYYVPFTFNGVLFIPFKWYFKSCKYVFGNAISFGMLFWYLILIHTHTLSADDPALFWIPLYLVLCDNILINILWHLILKFWFIFWLFLFTGNMLVSLPTWSETFVNTDPPMFFISGQKLIIIGRIYSYKYTYNQSII